MSEIGIDKDIEGKIIASYDKGAGLSKLQVDFKIPMQKIAWVLGKHNRLLRSKTTLLPTTIKINTSGTLFLPAIVWRTIDCVVGDKLHVSIEKQTIKLTRVKEETKHE